MHRQILWIERQRYYMYSTEVLMNWGTYISNENPLIILTELGVYRRNNRHSCIVYELQNMIEQISTCIRTRRSSCVHSAHCTQVQCNITWLDLLCQCSKFISQFSSDTTQHLSNIIGTFCPPTRCGHITKMIWDSSVHRRACMRLIEDSYSSNTNRHNCRLFTNALTKIDLHELLQNLFIATHIRASSALHCEYAHKLCKICENGNVIWK